MPKKDTFPKVYVKPRSDNQARYLQAMAASNVTICIGLPGTGKTFLAVAQALKSLQNNKVAHIVITRPLVEAGERLGYLPGDMNEKTYPFMRPIIYNIFKFMDKGTFYTLKHDLTIEVEPLAYMKGMTYDNSFMILDEAQNATIEHIEMFLTRMGKNSKAVLCGDPQQTDTPHNGLTDAMEALRDLKEVTITQLEGSDVVRHPLIPKIVRRLEQVKRSRRKNHHSNGSSTSRLLPPPEQNGQQQHTPAQIS